MREPQRQRGFALLTVLWCVSLLALIAALVLSSAVASRQISHIALERAQADALAEAGINDAILSLLVPQGGNPRRIDGVPYVLVLAGMEITVSIQDENGKIDLNHADRPVLARLFTSIGVPPEEAVALSDRVQDWREPSAGRWVQGAEPEDYRATGYDFGPRNGPFHSVDELKLVLGMTPEIYEKLAPALTVYSHRGAVNRQTASKQVLMVLGLTDDAGVEQFTGARGTAISSAILTDWAFSIRAQVTMPSGAAYGREAVVRITNDPRRPYWVHAWREISGKDGEEHGLPVLRE